jgi:hypothetical protein
MEGIRKSRIHLREEPFLVGPPPPESKDQLDPDGLDVRFHFALELWGNLFHPVSSSAMSRRYLYDLFFRLGPDQKVAVRSCIPAI